mmetsp:Transcript_375/g.518  ORF Transcript_375/g.518 Transcript_375/m.518 type:complete len:232 (-) Transcript_375:153-848(-)
MRSSGNTSEMLLLARSSSSHLSLLMANPVAPTSDLSTVASLLHAMMAIAEVRITARKKLPTRIWLGVTFALMSIQEKILACTAIHTLLSQHSNCGWPTSVFLNVHRNGLKALMVKTTALMKQHLLPSHGARWLTMPIPWLNLLCLMRGPTQEKASIPVSTSTTHRLPRLLLDSTLLRLLVASSWKMIRMTPLMIRMTLMIILPTTHLVPSHRWLPPLPPSLEVSWRWCFKQ